MTEEVAVSRSAGASGFLTADRAAALKLL